MTLLITGSNITLQNRSGQAKFNSDNRLVYQRYAQTGSVSVGAFAVQVPFSWHSENEFVILTITITSATGQADLNTAIINREIPANGGVLVDFYGRNVSNQPAADSEILGVQSIDGNLFFKTVRYTNQEYLIAGTTTINLIYNARIWSTL